MSEEQRAAEPVDMIDYLTEIIGEDAALLLAIRFGGRRLYIPKEPPPNGELAQAIGMRLAVLLARQAHGLKLHIPLERGKRERIIGMTQRGEPVADIARKLGCTERHVYYVRAEYRANGGSLGEIAEPPDPSQIDLFPSSHKE